MRMESVERMEQEEGMECVDSGVIGVREGNGLRGGNEVREGTE